MEEKKELSVVICTKNRSGVLAETLGALLNQLTDRDEVIVVDNGSTDDTHETVQGFQQGRIDVRYLSATTPGKSFARNKGIAHARGTYIGFLDDDANPLPGWRQSAAQAFTELPAHWGALQGQIIPKVDGEKPSWMSDRDFHTLTSRLMKGDKPFRLDKNPGLFTANVLCKKKALDAVGGFNRLFDRWGNGRTCGEDIELGIQIERSGYTVHYYPALKVHHVLPASRFTLDSLIQRRYYGAFGEYLVYYITKTGWRRLLFISEQMAKRPIFLLASYLGLGVGKMLGREQDVVFLRTRIARSLGYLQAATSLLRAKNP